jgi:hypothetical protein
MKRVITIVSVILVMVVAATAAPPPAGAANTPETQTFSLVGETIFLTGDGCVGENILVTSGTLVIRTLDSTTPSGRDVTSLQILYQNVSGIGTTTGTKYQIQDVLISTTTEWIDGGQFETTLANTGLRVVGPGPDNNRWAVLVTHVTADSVAGTIVVDFQHFDLSCR